MHTHTELILLVLAVLASSFEIDIIINSLAAALLSLLLTIHPCTYSKVGNCSTMRKGVACLDRVSGCYASDRASRDVPAQRSSEEL